MSMLAARLTSRRALEHSVQIERIILSFPESKDLLGGGHGRTAPGCSLCLAATPQESQIHVYRDGDAGGGDGANSTVLSWIDGTMLHPIPGARDTGDLVSLVRGEWNISPVPPLSYPDYRDLRDQNHSLSGFLAYNHDWITLTGGAQPERIYIANVSSNYFSVLGIQPFLGRFFLPEEETRPDAVPYVILSLLVMEDALCSRPGDRRQVD